MTPKEALIIFDDYNGLRYKLLSKEEKAEYHAIVYVALIRLIREKGTQEEINDLMNPYEVEFEGKKFLYDPLSPLTVKEQSEHPLWKEEQNEIQE